jgi:hypothetical protein
LSVDPTESNNLAPLEPELAAELAERIAAARRSDRTRP